MKGLAAQSKASVIGQNKISSANQRARFQMIFFFLVGFDFTDMSFCGSEVRTVVGYSVYEQRMNPLIFPFPPEKRLNVSEYARHGVVKFQGQECDCQG